MLWAETVLRAGKPVTVFPPRQAEHEAVGWALLWAELLAVFLRPFRVARAEASDHGGPQLTLLWAPQASIRAGDKAELDRFGPSFCGS